ncbi:MAG: TIGR04282 family arsenosugar biosynthesis glycosyltransferase [Bacteroidota bacterium]
MTKECLIIFSKNPVLGKVKTRLARTIGEEKALDTYRLLLRRTRDITRNLECDKVVYYSDYVNCEDLWNSEQYKKQKQLGEDLGIRMCNALNDQFSKGYERCIIIGTDCFELTSEIIENAFKNLEDKGAVVGPAEDGGYYLIGMTKPHQQVFQGIEWSTSKVFEKTIEIFENKNVQVVLMPTLSDVDEERDLETMSEHA